MLRRFRKDGPTTKPRPCWVVLAAGKRTKLDREILRVYGRDLDEEPCRWEIVQGEGDYLAVIEYEPGSQCAGDDALAAALSKRAKQPVYVLWLDPEMPRVQAFQQGKYAGEVRAWPDDVAAHLGCTFPHMDAGCRLGPSDLEIDAPVRAKAGELTVAGWTVKQWQQMMRDIEWSVMLDGAGDKSVDEVVAALEHADPEVRALACKLTDALGVTGLGLRAELGLERLRQLATADPDKGVRVLAKQAGDDLAAAILREAVRAEFPWIVNFNSASFPQALAALDDERRPVRLEVYSWWSNAWEVPADMRAKVKEKLSQIVDRESDPLTREVGHLALERMQQEG